MATKNGSKIEPSKNSPPKLDFYNGQLKRSSSGSQLRTHATQNSAENAPTLSKPQSPDCIVKNLHNTALAQEDTVPVARVTNYKHVNPEDMGVKLVQPYDKDDMRLELEQHGYTMEAETGGDRNNLLFRITQKTTEGDHERYAYKRGRFFGHMTEKPYPKYRKAIPCHTHFPTDVGAPHVVVVLDNAALLLPCGSGTLRGSQ
jgi:hypothetical protein